MSQPAASDVHVDAVLTNISVAYMQKAENFIADKVFPAVAVDKQSDKYYVFTKADWFRDEAKIQGDNAESVGSGYNLSTTAYFCDLWGMHKDVGKLTKANTDNPLDWRRNAVQFVTQRLLLRREMQWAADYFTTSVWGTDVVGGSGFTLWSTYASSDPVGDVETGKKTILSNTGFEPNTLTLGYDVYSVLKQHPDIIDRFKYTSSESVTPEMLAKIFDVERVLVAKAVKNTAVEGATASYSFVHGKNALLSYSPPSASLETPSAGYMFGWKGVSGGLGAAVAIKEIEMPWRNETTRIEGQMAFDAKVVSSDLGYFFSLAVA